MGNFFRSILITGGAGFIGSHTVRHFVNKYPDYLIINLDALTYAGNLANLDDIRDFKNYRFVKADIRDKGVLNEVFKKYNISHILHLAAESHVDRSISNPLSFVETNVIGTCNLLNTAVSLWDSDSDHLFYHVSTDEVYGSLGSQGYFSEHSLYDPHSPYSASKASSDHFVRAYYHTYGLPVVISNCSNNYGPYQFPEKLIPLMINNIIHERPLPVYGDGKNVRDWLYVADHVDAIDRIFHHGRKGETYNIGSNNELKNIELVRLLCDFMDDQLGKEKYTSQKLIRFVKDRPGHDLRYAIDFSKLSTELGWKAKHDIKEGLQKTITWYLENTNWLQNITSGEYQKYYKEQYQF